MENSKENLLDYETSRDLAYLLNSKINNAVEKAKNVYNHFGNETYEDFNRIKKVITDYVINGNSHHFEKTLACASVFYIIKQSNPLMSYNYFHDIFQVDKKSLKDCYKKIIKMEGKNNLGFNDFL